MATEMKHFLLVKNVRKIAWKILNLKNPGVFYRKIH